MRPFLPPDTRRIAARIAARGARRARRLLASLRPLARTAGRGEALRALEATLGTLRGSARAEWLLGPEARAWLAVAEEALALARPAGSDLALFERVARGPHLKRLLPRGRLDRGFRRRAARLGRALLDRAFRRLPVLLAFLTPAAGRYGPFSPDLSADGEEARVRGEVHVAHPVPATLRLRPGARVELRGGGVRIRQPGAAARWEARPLIVGSGIVLARRAVWTPRGLKPAGHVEGLSARLGRALDLVREAWPEAHEEILAHTRIVVPLEERGTVSFSLPDRPGTSYINVRGKSLVDLADDLLHETAHHRLHALEEVEGPLDRDDGEPRYHSPWRRTIRPLHGILHAAYTFTWRAELLRRLLALAAAPRSGRGAGARAPRATSGRRLPRAWIRRELEREIKMLRRSLGDLRDAERRGLLTPAGARLRRAIERRVETVVRRLVGSRRRR